MPRIVDVRHLAAGTVTDLIAPTHTHRERAWYANLRSIHNVRKLAPLRDTQDKKQNTKDAATVDQRQRRHQCQH